MGNDTSKTAENIERQRQLLEEEVKEFRVFMNKYCVEEPDSWVVPAILQSAWVSSSTSGSRVSTAVDHLIRMNFKLSGNISYRVVVGIKLDKWPHEWRRSTQEMLFHDLKR